MFIQTYYPTSASGDDRRFPLSLLAGGQGGLPPQTPHGSGLLFADRDDNGQEEQPSTDLVEPDIPTNLDDLTDDQLVELIRSLVAQAAALHQSGLLSDHSRHTPERNGGVFVAPVAQRFSLFSLSQEGGAK